MKRTIAALSLIFSLSTPIFADTELAEACLEPEQSHHFTVYLFRDSVVRIRTVTDQFGILTKIMTVYSNYLTENRSAREPVIEFIPRYTGDFNVIVTNKADDQTACYKLIIEK